MYKYHSTCRTYLTISLHVECTCHIDACTSTSTCNDMTMYIQCTCHIDMTSTFYMQWYLTSTYRCMQRYDKYILHATIWQVRSTCIRCMTSTSTCNVACTMYVACRTYAIDMTSTIYMSIDACRTYILHATICKYIVHAYRYDKYILHVISMHVQCTCHIVAMYDKYIHIVACRRTCHMHVECTFYMQRYAQVHSTCNDRWQVRST